MNSRALVLASLFAFFGVASTLASAQERGGLPVALDFTPIGETSVVASGRSAAPADINFGVYPLSVLGIENAIRRADEHVADYARGELRVNDGPIAYSVVAIRDWERRYPGDPWIAKDLLALARFYAHVGNAETRAYAERTATWVAHDYPRTAYAQEATHTLASVEDRPARTVSYPVEPRPESAVRPARATDPWSRLPPYAVPDDGRH